MKKNVVTLICDRCDNTIPLKNNEEQHPSTSSGEKGSSFGLEININNDKNWNHKKLGHLCTSCTKKFELFMDNNDELKDK